MDAWDKITGVAIVTGTVITFYNVLQLWTQGAADANFQEKYRRYAHSHLIDELYVSNKQFWVIGGLVIGMCPLLLMD